MTANPPETAPDWRTRAPQMLLDETVDAHGEPCTTPLDRRWLWRLEMFLAVSGTTPGHHQMAGDLRQYLNETCEHHWRAYDADPGLTVPAHRQCLWCADVEWAAEGGA